MSEPPTTRESVRVQLAEARSALRDLLASASEVDLQATPVTPEWNGLDMLRHILAWDEIAYTSLADWQASESLAPAFDDEDRFNGEQLALRADLSLPAIVARIEAVHQRFADELEHASDDALAVVGLAPWHARVSRLRAISGIAWHDGFHLGNIRDALSAHT